MTELSRDAVLTGQELADALHVSLRTVYRAKNLPYCWVGKRTKRYVWGQVLDAISTNAEVVTPPRKSRQRGRA